MAQLFFKGDPGELEELTLIGGGMLEVRASNGVSGWNWGGERLRG